MAGGVEGLQAGVQLNVIKERLPPVRATLAVY
jgi:hypothetical protein